MSSLFVFDTNSTVLLKKEGSNTVGVLISVQYPDAMFAYLNFSILMQTDIYSESDCVRPENLLYLR